MPNNAPVYKERHKLRILKLKDFSTLQNISFAYDFLEEERMKSFNTTFKQMAICLKVVLKLFIGWRLINFIIQDPV